jgi:hypothetical protein
MKSEVKILSVIVIIAFYSYSLGVINAPFNASVNSDNQKTGNGFYFSTISPNLFCYNFQKESSAAGNNSFPFTNFKLTFNTPGEIIKSTKQLFESEYNQYSRFSGNLLIQLSKTVIIFPFNYFW